MSLKRMLIKRRRWAVGMIVCAAVSAVAGRYLVDRIPIMALYFAIMGLIYLIVGIVDLHQANSILESMSDKTDKDKR